jgi:ribosomal protein L11 methylase PrmA
MEMKASLLHFLAGRGRAPSTAIGARLVREWARTLPRAAAVIDVGCGSGLPMSKILVSEGLNVYAISVWRGTGAGRRRPDEG